MLCFEIAGLIMVSWNWFIRQNMWAKFCLNSACWRVCLLGFLSSVLKYRFVFLNQICQIVDFVTVSPSRTLPMCAASSMKSFDNCVSSAEPCQWSLRPQCIPWHCISSVGPCQCGLLLQDFANVCCVHNVDFSNCVSSAGPCQWSCVLSVDFDKCVSSAGLANVGCVLRTLLVCSVSPT